MGTISLKEYAQRNSISYEAVRQQVARYREELGEHIIQEGRQQLLDDEAVAFLDDKRNKSPVVVIQNDLQAELATVKESFERLKIEYAKREGQLELLKQQLAEKESKLLLIGDAEARIQALTAERDAERDELVTQKCITASYAAEAKAAKDEAARARIEAAALQEKLIRQQEETGELKSKLEAIEAYEALPWWRKIKTKKPYSEKG